MTISAICACKNREKPLRISLGSWLVDSRIDEIIITDWSSNHPLRDLTKLDTRVKVIRVEGQEWFNQPMPLNLASKLVTGDELLKLDTDFIINPYYDFIGKYQIDETSFLSGENNQTEIHIFHSPYFKFLRGLLWLKTKHFIEIGGYNEDMGDYYAWEDSEIDIRLKMLGLSHTILDYDHNIIHIPHQDSLRTKFFKSFDPKFSDKVRDELSSYYSGDQLNWETEYVISVHHAEENKKRFSNPEHYRVKPKVNWNIQQIDEQYYEATII